MLTIHNVVEQVKIMAILPINWVPNEQGTLGNWSSTTWYFKSTEYMLDEEMSMVILAESRKEGTCCDWKLLRLLIRLYFNKDRDLNVEGCQLQ